MAEIPAGKKKTLSVEHPTGEITVIATMRAGEVVQAAILRTARKLFDGRVHAG